MKKHRLRIHKWDFGRLKVKDHFFDTYREILEFLTIVDFDTYKIYDPDDRLIYSDDIRDAGAY